MVVFGRGHPKKGLFAPPPPLSNPTQPNGGGLSYVPNQLQVTRKTAPGLSILRKKGLNYVSNLKKWFCIDINQNHVTASPQLANQENDYVCQKLWSNRAFVD